MAIGDLDNAIFKSSVVALVHKVTWQPAPESLWSLRLRASAGEGGGTGGEAQRLRGVVTGECTAVGVAPPSP